MLLAEKYSTPLEIQRRAYQRVTYREPCFVQTDTHALWVRANNISEGGMCLTVEEFGALKRGTNAAMFLQNFPAIDATVRWTRGNIVGLQFTVPVEDHPHILALIHRLRGGQPAWVPIGEEDIRPKTNDDFVTHHNVTGGLSDDRTENSCTARTDHLVQRRAHQRLAYDETCWLRTPTRTFQARAQNISEGGMRLRILGLGKLHNGTDCEVFLEDYEPLDATLRWTKDRVLGLQFLTPIKDHPILRRVTREADQNAQIEAQRKRTDTEKVRKFVACSKERAEENRPNWCERPDHES